jgi:hypothetical protein
MMYILLSTSFLKALLSNMILKYVNILYILIKNSSNLDNSNT